MWKPDSVGVAGWPDPCQVLLLGTVPRDAKVVPLSCILVSLRS